MPVFERELMNKMYTPTPYLFGRMFSHVLLQIFSPILMSLILYFGLGADNTFENFMAFVLVALEVNLIGCFVGYFCGVAFKSSDAARQTGTLLMIIFHLLSGGLSNPAAVNPFINGLQYASPNRYSVEMFFRVITYNSPIFCDSCPMTITQVEESIGFTLGPSICYPVLTGFIFFFMGLAWFTIVQKNKKFVTG